MSLYRKNPAWRRNPKKLQRALAAILIKQDAERAAAELDSATAEYDRIKKEETDGRVG